MYCCCSVKPGAGAQVIERLQAPNYGRIKAENALLQKQLLLSAWRMLRGLAQDMQDILTEEEKTANIQVTIMEQSSVVFL